ncbi:MAG TPA: NAD(P)H-binding protein [Microbacteriaceae bacterium]|nr:NAD(P)H-binding protein [Microbacteriaceae bacterium]
MSTITVIGGTGYAGSNIVAEAASRGHAVTAVSRTAPAEPVAGVDYRQGSVDDAAFVADAIAGADAVVAALSPRGDMEGRVASLYRELAAAAAEAGARFIVIGGFNGLRAEEGGPRYAAALTDDFPFKAEAQEMTDVVEWLQSDAPAGLDWTFVSPPAAFGGYAPGERTGAYRVGGDVSLAGDAGAISGADFGTAIVDAIERGEHGGGSHIGLAY